MAGTLDQALRGANKLEKSKRSSEALKLIENALSKWPNSPRLVEKQQQIRLSIIKSDVDREPPIFVKKRLAELYKAAEWKHIIKIGTELLKLHPVSGFVLDLLAIAFRETGNLEKAEMLHRQSIASEPQNAAFYVNYSNFSPSIMLDTHYIRYFNNIIYSHLHKPKQYTLNGSLVFEIRNSFETKNKFNNKVQMGIKKQLEIFNLTYGNNTHHKNNLLYQHNIIGKNKKTYFSINFHKKYTDFADYQFMIAKKK